MVDCKTVEVYNQIAEIKYNQEHGFVTQLVDRYDIDSNKEKKIAIIKAGDKIPYELWNNQGGVINDIKRFIKKSRQGER